MRLNARLIFAILVPDGQPAQATLLQGFAPSLLRNEWMIRAISTIPSSIYDFAPKARESLAARRISGADPINWVAVGPTSLRSLPSTDGMPFVFVLAGKGIDAREYKEWAAGYRINPTIVAFANGDISFSDFGIDSVRRRLQSICAVLPDSIVAADVKLARDALMEWQPSSEKQLPYTVGGHNATGPNVMVLTSLGYANPIRGRFKELRSDDKPLIEQIINTTRSVLDSRRVSAFGPFGRTPDINLFAPSIFPHVFDSPLSDANSGSARRDLDDARRMLERQTGYSFNPRSAAQRRVFYGDSDTTRPTPLHPLIALRARELSLSTACMCALAVSEVSAVVRLTNGVNRTSGRVRNFASNYRSNDPSPGTRVKVFRDVQRALSAAVPSDLLDLISNNERFIRLVTDAHLEWLEKDGLPLCISRDVVRIPVTPGNLFVQIVRHLPQTMVSPEDLTNVLLIHASSQNDPIRVPMRFALDHVERRWRGILTLTEIDVTTEREFIDALNQFSGKILIFDGHGTHEKGGTAKIYIGKTPLDVWGLRGRVTHVPPIVLLSACDTHAADRNHATTANGFLALGAVSVLASVFPLEAADAAAFLARLLHRLAVLVPQMNELLGRAITWNEVVSGMIRVQLLTDYLDALLSRKAISEELFVEAHTAGNTVLNGADDDKRFDPFNEANKVLRGAGVTELALAECRESSLANSSAISYIQLGRPETIVINTKRVLNLLAVHNQPNS